jgi:molybdopterin converting factor small subunit
MRVRVRWFGPLRDLAPDADRVVEADAGETAAGLAARLLGPQPSGFPVRYAVNGSFVPGETVLADGDEMAVIPPVSGG